MRRCLFALSFMAITTGSGAETQHGTVGAITVDTPFIEARSPGGIAFLSRFDVTAADAAISFGWRDGAAADAPFHGTVWASADNLAAAFAAATSALKASPPQGQLMIETVAVVGSQFIAQRAAIALGLGDHPLVRRVSTIRLDGLDPVDISPWQRGALDRARLHVAVAGNASAIAAGPILDAAFADLPERSAPPPLDGPVITAPKPRTIVIEQATADSAILMVGRTDIASGPPTQLAALANSVLSGAVDNRINLAVGRRSAASETATSMLNAADPTQLVLQLTATVSHAQLGAALVTLRQTYAAWHADGITAAEFAEAVTHAIVNARERWQDPVSASQLALASALAGRPLSDLYDLGTLMAALTPSDINDMIRHQFPPLADMMTIVVTPSAARLIEAGLTVHCLITSLVDIELCRR